MRKTTFLSLALLLAGGFSATAKDYPVSSAKELSALHLKPGDRVLMKEGNWKDQQLKFKGMGSQDRPIVLMAANQGKTILNGNSTLDIDGSWLLVDGLSFAKGALDSGEVINFS